MRTALDNAEKQDEQSLQPSSGVSRGSPVSPETFSVCTPKRDAMNNESRVHADTPTRFSTSSVPVSGAAQDASSVLRQSPHKPCETRQECALKRPCKRLSEMRQIAARLRGSLAKDTERCTDSDRQRLQETLEQLQPDAGVSSLLSSPSLMCVRRRPSAFLFSQLPSSSTICGYSAVRVPLSALFNSILPPGRFSVYV